MPEHSPNTQAEKSTRIKLIEAATELFSARGYTATTTRAIAESAGLSEVTLFRHFGSKENLLRETMEEVGGPALAKVLRSQLTGNLQADLLLVAQVMLQVMKEKNDAMRMAICEAGRFPELREIVAENPRQLRQVLTGYFEDQIAQDAMRQAHPEVLAQAFLGMFFSYTVLQGFLNDSLDPSLSEDQIAREFVDLFLHGIENTGD